MMEPKKAPVEHQIRISLGPEGKPSCSPCEMPARRGELVRWVGVAHTGEILGRIIGPKQRGYSQPELEAGGIEWDPTKKPFSQNGVWGPGSSMLRVNDDAEPGAYKYSVTVNGVVVDPVVIIEDDGGDDGPQ